MKIIGSYCLDATCEEVYAALNDLGALLEIIPGCQEIQQVGSNEYRGKISLRLPAVVGVYDTYIRRAESQPPTSSRFEGQVEGALGMVKGSAFFTLAGQGSQTLMEYQGEGQITGPLARLDSRFIEGLAISLIDQSLARLNQKLQDEEMSN